MGLGVYQQGGNTSERRMVIPPRDILREPPVAVTAALLPPCVLPHTPLVENGTQGSHAPLPEFWI